MGVHSSRGVGVVAVVAVGLALVGLAPAAVRPPAVSAATCDPLPHAAGASMHTISSGGIPRTYELYVPASYDASTPMPLVLNFHGLGSEIIEQVYLSDLYPRADAQGFMVATLQGRSTPALTLEHWNNLHIPSAAGENDDVAFVTRVIDEVASNACVDVARVYATGMSNGAQMSTRLGCSLASRIAAIAPVGGVYFPPMSTSLFPGETCPDTRPMPIIAFHGTDDPRIPYNGGAGAMGYVFRDIDDVVMPAWVARNGCNPVPATSIVAPGVSLTAYSACADDALVELYTVFDYDGDGPATTGGGHIWPGSPYKPAGHSDAIEATDLMLSFFEDHPLACAGGDGDCDGVADGSDNCVAAYNPGQPNADANFTSLYPKKSYDDLTQVNSDLAGNACDADDDNDGRSDADELAGAACGAFTTPTDPFNADSDGDYTIDGAECAIGFDPATFSVTGGELGLVAACVASPLGGNGDADGDGLPAFRELCQYGTSDALTDTDGDGCGDGRELASINADKNVNAIDLSQVAQAFGGKLSSNYIRDFDFTRDALISAADLSQVAQRFGNC